MDHHQCRTITCSALSHRNLFDLACQEEWDAFATTLKSLDDGNNDNGSSSVVLEETYNTEPFLGSDSTILHVVCSFPSAPPSIVQALLNKRPQLALVVDSFGQNPLHNAVSTCASADTILPLVQASPPSAQQRDYALLRPIDVLCQKVIMQEERSKYQKKQQQQQSNNGKKGNHKNDNHVQDQLWECVRLLAVALLEEPFHDNNDDNHHSDDSTRDWTSPTLHACLRANPYDFPYALLERAMNSVFVHEYELQDSRGDLPLHIVAGWSPDDDVSDQFVTVIADHYRAAAKIYNGQGKLPLDVALDSKLRDWDSGIADLLALYPAPDRFSMALSTLILAKAATTATSSNNSSRGRTILYQMLRSQPNFFAYRNKKSKVHQG